jgi:integrase
MYWWKMSTLSADVRRHRKRDCGRRRNPDGRAEPACSRLGTLGYSRLRRAFSDSAAGIEGDPHTCRHTFASILIDQGPSIEFVADQPAKQARRPRGTPMTICSARAIKRLRLSVN